VCIPLHLAESSNCKSWDVKWTKKTNYILRGNRLACKRKWNQKYEARCPDMKKKECTWYLMAALQVFNEREHNFKRFSSFVASWNSNIIIISQLFVSRMQDKSVFKPWQCVRAVERMSRYLHVQHGLRIKVRHWLSQRKHITEPTYTDTNRTFRIQMRSLTIRRRSTFKYQDFKIPRSNY